jgi:hypothetical protein
MLRLLNDISGKEGVEDIYPFGEFHHLILKNQLSKESLEQWIKNATTEKVLLQTVQPDIEDCFISLMKAPNHAPNP